MIVRNPPPQECFVTANKAFFLFTCSCFFSPNFSHLISRIFTTFQCKQRICSFQNMSSHPRGLTLEWQMQLGGDKLRPKWKYFDPKMCNGRYVWQQLCVNDVPIWGTNSILKDLLVHQVQCPSSMDLFNGLKIIRDN